MSEWKESALLARHYAGLPDLITWYLTGQDGDGIKLTDPEALVRRVFGRAGRCTYVGLGMVDADTLIQRVEAAGGEISIAEAKALLDGLKSLNIMQGMCKEGHLPALRTGPVTFEFLHTNQQCPVCRGRILDPDPTEFRLIWNQDRLGHPSERLVQGVDGRLYPTDAGSMQGEMRGGLHAWFTQADIEGKPPSLEEIALILFKGHSDGRVTVRALAHEGHVLMALVNPAQFKLTAWECETIVRVARGRWMGAHHPFKMSEAETLIPQASTGGVNRGSAMRHLQPLLMQRFNNSNLSGFLCSLRGFEQIASELPSEDVPQGKFVSAVVRTLVEAQLINRSFMIMLVQHRPNCAIEITEAFAAMGIHVPDYTQDEFREKLVALAWEKPMKVNEYLQQLYEALVLNRYRDISQGDPTDLAAQIAEVLWTKSEKIRRCGTVLAASFID
jgi:hypothetical protein